MRRGLVLVLALGAVSAASAHVAPSVDDNNRYLKLTPLGDRVRLAYVIFYGEIPGARLRPAIDADHDGAISDAEGQAFGVRIGAEVAAALDVSIDGAPQRIAWSTISAGMGSPQVAAGSFSLDLVASLCLRGGRGRHELRLIDRLRLPRPGETELRIEDSPGVRIERAAVGDEHDAAGMFRFRGPGGALAGGGLQLAFTVGDGAFALADGACAAASRGRGALPTAALAGAAAAAAALGGVGAALAIRRRRRHRRGAHDRDQSART
jgi:hypothetical protein